MFIPFKGGDAHNTSVKCEKLKTVDLAIHDIKGLFEQWQAFSHKSLSRKNFPAQNNDLLGCSLVIMLSQTKFHKGTCYMTLLIIC